MGQDSFIYVGDELELFSEARNWRNYWTEVIEPYLGESVLEVGAGIGSVTTLLAERRTRWVAVEPDESLAGQIVQGAGYASVEVVVGTVRDVAVTGQFDSVLYIDVLEHIEDDRGELEEAAKRLRPGGRLIVLVPAHMSLYSPFDRAIGHFRRYNRTRLLGSLPQGGSVKVSTYMDSVGLLASGMNRFFLRSNAPTKQQISFWDKKMIPVSRRTDRLLRGQLGKSLLVIWEKKS